jgi:large subunit ribosomal protein L22
MFVKASQRNVRLSSRKARLVIDVVRGQEVGPAQEQLKFMNRGAATPVLKVLEAAVANAKENYDIQPDNLYIKEIKADEGPTLKRWRPRAQGRAYPIMKRTTSISIVLDQIVKDKKGRVKKQAKIKAQATDQPATKKGTLADKQPPADEQAAKKGLLGKARQGLGKRFFRRKGNM